jgi:hypothetical protein
LSGWDRHLLNHYHPNCTGGLKPFLGDAAEAIRSIDDERIPGDVRSMLVKK